MRTETKNIYKFDELSPLYEDAESLKAIANHIGVAQVLP